MCGGGVDGVSGNGGGGVSIFRDASVSVEALRGQGFTLP
jgi:hypothetical protein